MEPEQTPITGKDNLANLTPAIQALSRFYTAFNSRNLDLMNENWDPSGQTTMDNPLGGIKRGWGEIRVVYEKIFSGPARVTVEFYDYTLHETGEMFFAVGRERGSFKIGETVIDLAIRTTRIFRRIKGEWKQVHHHGSIEDPKLLDRYQKAVMAA